MSNNPAAPEEQPVSGLQKLVSENVLAGLITIMTILTAFTVYQASLAGGESLKSFFYAQGYLTDANSLYIEGGQEIFYDLSVYDQHVIAFRNGDDELADYFLDQLSEAGLAGLERDIDNPFDEEYFNTVYAEPNALIQEADDAFTLAEYHNSYGDSLTLVATILSVGLAFAAWGSLAAAHSRQRVLFAVFGTVAMLVAVLYLGWIVIFSTPPV